MFWNGRGKRRWSVWRLTFSYWRLAAGDWLLADGLAVVQHAAAGKKCSEPKQLLFVKFVKAHRGGMLCFSKKSELLLFN
jgi:hypothetical protein